MALPLVHHVGFVIASIAGGIDSFARSVQAVAKSAIIHDPIQDVRVAFLKTPLGGPLIELVEPASEKSPVAKFLSRGGGLHHLCYEVPDLAEQLSAARACRCAVVRSPQPAVAFGGRPIAWVVTREKLLIEYLQR